MKIAYLILAHTDPKQLKNLISALDSEHSTIFIHVDKKSDYSEFTGGIQNIRSDVVFLKNRLNVYWAGFSIVASTLLLIQEALRYKQQFDRYILLSGVDYPIKSNRYIEEFFCDNPKDYIDHFALPGMCWLDARGGLDRFTQFHFNDFRPLNPLNGKTRIVSNAIGNVLKLHGRLFPRKMPNRWKAYGGHQFWSLSHSTIMYLVNLLEKDKKIVKFFRLTYAPDELFFQTILCNSSRADNLVNNSLRFVLWERENPAVLNIQDWDQIATCDALFARKLDSNKSLELLKLIDNNILESAPPQLGPTQ